MEMVDLSANLSTRILTAMLKSHEFITMYGTKVHLVPVIDQEYTFTTKYLICWFQILHQNVLDSINIEYHRDIKLLDYKSALLSLTLRQLVFQFKFLTVIASLYRWIVNYTPWRQTLPSPRCMSWKHRTIYFQ